jgi:hypothetical protein
VATSAGTTTIAVADAAHVLDIPSYEKAFVKYPGFFADWNGTITAGASLVEATQTSETFNGSVNLVRAIPAEDWLARRNRTAFDFSTSYGEQTQPSTPSIKTSIYRRRTGRIFLDGSLRVRPGAIRSQLFAGPRSAADLRGGSRLERLQTRQ